MPTYEYACRKCKKTFEVSLSIAEYERKKGTRCPECGSSSVERLISGLQVQTSKKS